MNINRTWNKANGGFGLIELMIAILLGIVVLGGVGQVFYSTSQAYRTQQSVARVQEAGRFAIEILKPRLLPAGRLNYCVDSLPINNVLNTGNANYEAAVHDPNLPIVGFEFTGTDSTDTFPLPTTLGTGAVSSGDYSTSFGLVAVPQGVVDNAIPGSDVLIVKYAAPVDQITACSYDQSTADLILNYPVDCGATPAAVISQARLDEIYPLGRLVIASQCRRSGDHFFQRTNVGSPQFSINDGGTTPGNLPALMGLDYDDTSQVLPVNSLMFFVGVNAAGQPALFQSNYGTDAVPEEIVEGVESMQLLFGEVDGLGSVTYLEPDQVTSPINVVSIRVALLMRSTQNADLEVDEALYGLNGTQIDPVDDSRLRQVFFTTVAIRNRINVI